MKGKHFIKVRNRRIQFTLELERNITIIRGDSATGKSTMVGMIQDYEAQGNQSGVVVESDKPCHVLTNIDWEERLRSFRDCIVFVDEGSTFLSSYDFAHAIRGTSNYYVLITRVSLHQLPYSVDAVLELRKTTSRFKRTYNKTYRYYDRLPDVTGRLSNVDRILTEDSNSGHQMFAHIAETHGIRSESAQGKSNIYDCLKAQLESRTLVVADGAAFGADMDTVYKFQKLHPHSVTLYLPESFEWLILKSGIIRDGHIVDILKDPSKYIDPVSYFSWEQFFTALLMELTTELSYMRYNKQRLSDFYLQDDNVQKVLDAMEIS